MARPKGRTERCAAADARVRLEHARVYLAVADTVLGEEIPGEATVATGNAVLAAIAAADAICCASAGSRYRGQDHARSAEHLQSVTGDKQLGALLREVLNLKDIGHYGLDNVVAGRARSAARKARKLVEEAERRVR